MDCSPEDGPPTNALAVLDSFESNDLCTRANELGGYFLKRARRWQQQWPEIGEIRGLGAMQTIELVRSPQSREPADEETKQIVQYCYEHGVIILSSGSYSNVIRLLMPLVITNEQMSEALDVLESALQTTYEKKREAVAQPV